MSDETTPTPEPPPAPILPALDALAEIGAPSAAALRPDGLPVGRPFAPGVCTNPGGRPKDPVAAMLRKMSGDGEVVCEFLIAVIKDDLDGRIAGKAVGVVDDLEIEAGVVEAELKRAREEGDVMNAGRLETKARELRSRAKAWRAKLSRKRKIPVNVKTRVAAAALFFDRAYGKARETIDLKIGGDGTPIGAPMQDAPGALGNLTGADLADLAAVLERATKRGEVVTVEASPAPAG